MRVFLIEAKNYLIGLIRWAKVGKTDVAIGSDPGAVRPVPNGEQCLDAGTRRRLLESIRSAGSAKAKPGANAAESQDFFYDGRGLP